MADEIGPTDTDPAGPKGTDHTPGTTRGEDVGKGRSADATQGATQRPAGEAEDAPGEALGGAGAE